MWDVDSDFGTFLGGKLSVNSLEVTPVGVLQSVQQFLGALSQVAFHVLGAFGNGGVPGRLKLEDLSSQVKGGSSQVAGNVLKESVLHQGKLEKVS